MFLKIICLYEKCAFICQLYANIMFSVKSLCLLLFFVFFLPGQNLPSRTRSILTAWLKCRFLGTHCAVYTLPQYRIFTNTPSCIVYIIWTLTIWRQSSTPAVRAVARNGKGTMANGTRSSGLARGIS